MSWIRGKGFEERSWKGLACAKRAKGTVLAGLSDLGLVLSCLLISCLILYCWGEERGRGKGQSDGSLSEGQKGGSGGSWLCQQEHTKTESERS